MFRKVPLLIALSSLLASSAFSQGMQTRASKDDWEEINFEFNSSVLSDGYPSLLRLAELLNKNPGYRVKVEGHTDGIGGARYNEKLGLARANTVRDFLVKYGANATQIQTGTRGKSDPEVPGEKRRYSKTDVARWMNRRVVITVTDDQGRTVSAGSVGDAIRSMTIDQLAAQQQKCCDEILRRLDRLDEIAKMLQGMVDQNAALRKDVDTLRAAQDALANQVRALPKPLSEEQTSQVVDTRLERFRDPRFSLMGINIGADSDRHVTFSGKGRFFAPFKDHFAVQAQGEYMYFKNMREGQFDLGLVDRMGNFQAGLFSSFKHVNFQQYANGGTLGQASLTLDYISRLGRIGLFGAKGFMGDAVLNRANWTFNSGLNPDGTLRMVVAPNVFLESYIRVVDQVGVSAALGLWGRNYLEANVGYLRSKAHADRPGGSVKFVFPFADRLAFTVEGGVNETLLAANNWGRAVVGLQFGNFVRPRDMQASQYPVPADIPRVRYELLTRIVRTGATPPVADAGPDQIGIQAGTVTLSGNNSYDPNGERLTYQWTQEAGPSVALSGANTVTATFPAVAGQTYVFRLTVTNQSGLSSSARVRVSTRAAEQVQILSFVANPTTINPGQESTLTWRVANADTVTITGVGTVPAQGSATVSPTTTTTYTMTATNPQGTQNATVTVVVNIPQLRVFGCSAGSANLTSGQSTTITFGAENATAVSVSPTVSGTIPTNGGSFTVSPTSTTTYTITALGANNQSQSCTVTINVAVPQTRVFGCSTNVGTINSGQSAVISFQTENATSVNVNPTVSGSIPVNGGSFSVSPTQTTTYTITANGANNQTQTCTVTVNVASAQARVFGCFAAPTSIAAGGTTTIAYQAENATAVSVSPTVAGATLPNSGGTFSVSPTANTTYTITVTGQNGQTATCSVPVVVTASATPTISACSATPTNINAGEATTISYQTSNVTNVTVSPTVTAQTPAGGGSFVVSPTATTTYTLTATGANNQTQTCTVTVNVNPGTGLPRIIAFGANPTTVTAGTPSTLSWTVENATTVTINNGVGTVDLTGTKSVTPTTTTMYTITASNANGAVTSTATVTVNQPAPTITAFTASPAVAPYPGAPVVLSCLANNATTVTIDQGAGALVNGAVTVNPQANTTYTCTATGTGGTATQTVAVAVTPAQPPTVIIVGAPTINTFVRLVTLNATAVSPINSPLTYSWVYVPDGNQPASIQNPNSPNPSVYLGGTFGDYRFDLTVTDQSGNSTTSTIIVHLNQVSAY